MEHDQHNSPYAKERIHTTPWCILIVDDEQPILDLLRDIFEEEGYTVLAARNGKDAAALVRQSSVDIVLTDYMMPQMDGTKLIEALRANPHTADVPVLLMSAVNVPKSNGYNALIRKPFDIASVLDRVATQLSHTSPDDPRE